jgi:hypothetical protein
LNVVEQSWLQKKNPERRKIKIKRALNRVQKKGLKAKQYDVKF